MNIQKQIHKSKIVSKLILFLLLLLSSCVSTVGDIKTSAQKGDFEFVYGYINSESPELRAIAADNMLLWKDARAFEYFIKMLDHEDKYVRGRAVIGLKDYINDTKVRQRFFEILAKEDLSYKTNLAILESLVPFITEYNANDTDFLATLQRQYNSDNDMVKLMVCRCYAKMGLTNRVEFVVDMCQNAMLNTRVIALETIGYYGDRSHIPMLSKIAENGDSYSRYASMAIDKINALSKVETSKSVKYSSIQIIENGKLLPNEFVANSIRDVNGDVCSGVIIISNISGLSYESSNGIVKIDSKPGQDILYLSPDERILEVFLSGIVPMRIVLRDYGINLEQGKMYTLKLQGVE